MTISRHMIIGIAVAISAGALLVSDWQAAIAVTGLSVVFGAITFLP